MPSTVWPHVMSKPSRSFSVGCNPTKQASVEPAFFFDPTVPDTHLLADIFPDTIMLEEVILNDQKHTDTNRMYREVDISDGEIWRLYLSAY